MKVEITVHIIELLLANYKYLGFPIVITGPIVEIVPLNEKNDKYRCIPFDSKEPFNFKVDVPVVSYVIDSAFLGLN